MIAYNSLIENIKTLSMHKLDDFYTNLKLIFEIFCHLVQCKYRFLKKQIHLDVFFLIQFLPKTF